MDTVHECDRQTDRRTDGQTDRITITDTVQRIASHGKNDTISLICGKYLFYGDGNFSFICLCILIYNMMMVTTIMMPLIQWETVIRLARAK